MLLERRKKWIWIYQYFSIKMQKHLNFSCLRQQDRSPGKGDWIVFPFERANVGKMATAVFNTQNTLNIQGCNNLCQVFLNTAVEWRKEIFLFSVTMKSIRKNRNQTVYNFIAVTKKFWCVYDNTKFIQDTLLSLGFWGSHARQSRAHAALAAAPCQVGKTSPLMRRRSSWSHVITPHTSTGPVPLTGKIWYTDSSREEDQ